MRFSIFLLTFLLLCSCIARRSIIETERRSDVSVSDSMQVVVEQNLQTMTDSSAHTQAVTRQDIVRTTDKGLSAEEYQEQMTVYFDSLGRMQKVVAELNRTLRLQNDYQTQRLHEYSILNERLDSKTMEVSQLRAELYHLMSLHEADSIRIAEEEAKNGSLRVSENDRFYIKVGKAAAFVLAFCFVAVIVFVIVKTKGKFC